MQNNHQTLQHPGPKGARPPGIVQAMVLVNYTHRAYFQPSLSTELYLGVSLWWPHCLGHPRRLEVAF